MPLARARARWPDYTRCVQAVSDWTRTLGLPGMLASSDVALMACRGAKYHHDGEQYGRCRLLQSLPQRGPGSGLAFSLYRLSNPPDRGTVVIFDTGQPHGVIQRGSSGFNVDDFVPGRDCTQVFLTWELPIEDAHVAQALGVAFDIAPSTSLPLDEEQIWTNGARATVCPDSGRWVSGRLIVKRQGRTAPPRHCIVASATHGRYTIECDRGQ